MGGGNRRGLRGCLIRAGEFDDFSFFFIPR